MYARAATLLTVYFNEIEQQMSPSKEALLVVLPSKDDYRVLYFLIAVALSICSVAVSYRHQIMNVDRM